MNKVSLVYICMDNLFFRSWYVGLLLVENCGIESFVGQEFRFQQAFASNAAPFSVRQNIIDCGEMVVIALEDQPRHDSKLDPSHGVGE